MAKVEPEPGGELQHSLTATAPDRIEFMKNAGLPLTTHARKRFTEVEPPRRLVYLSEVDFVPGREPYEHLTTVELSPQDRGVRVVMTVEPMHDDDWTQRLVAGRTNLLAGLLSNTVSLTVLLNVQASCYLACTVVAVMGFARLPDAPTPRLWPPHGHHEGTQARSPDERTCRHATTWR